ncbi:alpha/beta-hydrolase [Terfezia boudieri ATCC MYA-4762]|uniref:Alpha/beta-hydrolase n=1 Tax=Terfezia boudieri ATCC MYA-4762 TaxID=1051890 RepID=A0A3N4M3B1_9PEZI|nr:alpha/beta-hydrolase [Terfezia boudieri ATCC MYA-4762]
MPFNTLSVACATTPTVISTFFSHFLNPTPLVDTPFSHLSYHEGVALIRRFLVYSSYHTVEQLQAFTAQYVPHPTWVHTEDEKIPETCINDAASHLMKALGPETLKKVGGQKWWQWRTRPLQVEWIEMRSDYRHRRKNPEEKLKTMLYIHGGAYYFGSVDEHRYQMQRHARKLHARVFAPRYRLAPQFPFPCAIHDALACYLHLLQLHDQDASRIIFAGDSAGGGLVLSLLTILRDQCLPLPAGAVLISPWVDLCHSFPSVTGDNSKDYLPSHGFLHRPSAAWPPPTREELAALTISAFTIDSSTANTRGPTTAAPPTDGPPPPIPTGSKNVETTINTSNLTVTVGDTTIPPHDQLQMYTTNDLLAHPLVSPVNAPSLGGLCPLLVLVGGGEVLMDEQIYIAHKAANPPRFPVNPVHAEGKSKEERGRDEEVIRKWSDKPTKVMLQVFDDCCHVTPTLSFTRPAKLMYRSIAHFSLWALSSANNDPTTSIAASAEDSSLSSTSIHPPATASSEEDIDYTTTPRAHMNSTPALPPFDPTTNMIRQRISYLGDIYDLPPIPLAPITTPKEDDDPHPTITATPPPHRYTAPLLHPPASIGILTAEPIRRWLEGKREWDEKYARELKQAKSRRAKIHTQLLVQQLNEARRNIGGSGDVSEKEEERDNPPPSALYGRTVHAFEEEKGERLEAKRRSKNAAGTAAGAGAGVGLGLWGWSKLGWGHDQHTVVREKKEEIKMEKMEKKAHKIEDKEAKRKNTRRKTSMEPVLAEESTE